MMNPNVFNIITTLLLPAFYLLGIYKHLRVFFAQSGKRPSVYSAWFIYYAFLVIMRFLPPVPHMEIIHIFSPVLLYVIIIRASYKTTIKKSLSVSVLLNVISIVLSCTAYLLFLILDLPPESRSLAGLVTIRISMFASAAIIDRFINRKDAVYVPASYLIAILLVPIGSIYLTYTIALIAAEHASYQDFSSFVCILLLLINYIVFDAYDRILQFVIIQKKNLRYEHQLKLCHQNAETRKANDLKVRALHHNRKDNLICILGMIERDKPDAAAAYIKDLLKYKADRHIPSISNTGNIIVDSLIDENYALAMENGTDFQSNVLIPADLPVHYEHLTLILGNLLQNALDASARVKTVKSFISLDASYSKGLLSIILRNSYEGRVIRDKYGNFLSSKQDSENHGIGHPVIRQALEPYHGNLECTCTAHVFEASVILYVPREPEESAINCSQVISQLL